MPKHLDQLGSFENFQFSSVLTAEEIDRDKLKKYVFGLLTDKAKAQDARDAAKSETAEVQTELDEANVKLSSNAPADLQAKLARAEKDRDDAKAELAKRDRADLAVTVAEEAGLTKAQAKYLDGNTEDELKASAEQFIKDNGIQVKDPDEDEDPEDEELTLHRTPRATALNPADPDPRKGPEKEPDYEAVVAGFESSPFR